jgi:hypothetical protein
MPTDDWIGMATQYIMELAALQTCPLKSSRNKGGQSKCTCLHNHFAGQQDSGCGFIKKCWNRCGGVLCILQGQEKRVLDDFHQVLADAIFGQGKKSQKFVLLERDFAANNANESDDDEDNTNTIPHPICQSALMIMVLRINSNAWRTVSKAAETNIILQHGLKFKPSTHPMTADTTLSLKKYFKGLKDHAGPRATRIVQTHAGTALCGDSDAHELPTNWTKRAIFTRWLKENGYSIAMDGHGVSIITRRRRHQVVHMANLPAVLERQSPKDDYTSCES